MNDAPTYSAEISVYINDETGLRIECSEKFSSAIISYLSSRGFVCSNPNVLIRGTSNISNWMEFFVRGGGLDELLKSIKEFLAENRIVFAEELAMSPGEKHQRFDLLTQSVFDK